ncbi:MAG TPA: TonB-dependent receptor [Chitinophagaceae bacterium]|nr:TonB-dependent receptor [Chitinophagaceae bacterium]
MRSKTIVLLLCLCFAQSLKAQPADTTVSGLLKLSLEDLMNIRVVTASGYMQTTAEAPATITVITSEQIEDRGYEQLEDALRDVPGIDMIHINGYAPTLFYFRGMYGAENLRALLMIDGIVENNILGSNDLAGPAYSLHNVERIEIIWGPVSARYGANAFGGVINIISKKGADIDGLHLQQGIGSFNTLFEKVLVGVKKSRFEFAVGATLYSTDGPKFTNRDPLYSASAVDRAFSVTGLLSYDAKKSTTTFGYRAYKTPMGWGTYANSPTAYLHLPPQGNNNHGTIGVIQREFRGEHSGVHDPFLRTWFLQNEYHPTIKWNLLSRLVYRETGSGEDSYIYVTVDGRRLIRALIGTFSNRISGELIANYTHSDKHRFAAGLQVNQDNVEEGSRKATFDLSTVYLVDGRDTVVNLRSTFLPRQFDIRNNIGGYLQYSLHVKLLGKTSFTVAARYDDNSYFGDVISPRLAIVNQPTDKFTFKFQVGKAFRAPTNLEIYQTPPTGTFKLKYEKLLAYELNAIYSPSKRFRAQLNAFRNELNDVIVLGNLSSPLTPDKNPAIHRVTGVEGIFEREFSKNVSAFMNVTYQYAWGKNLVTGDGGKLPAIADIKANAGFRCMLEDLLTIHLGGNYVGDRPVQRSNPYGTVKSYFLTHLAISTKKLVKDRVTASVTVHNLFDTKWLDPGFRTADGLLYSTVMEQAGINGIFKIGIQL